MNEDYGGEYAALYRRHWWWRAREAILLAEMRRLPLPRQADILDVGCGDAVFFPELAKFGDVRGIEVDRGLVRAGNPYRGQVFHEPLGHAAYSGWQFDLITALDVLEHIEDDRAAVASLAAMLRPGGYLVATVPAFMLLWDAHDERNHHFRRYRRHEFESLLKPHGELIELRYLFHHLFFLKAGFRLVNRASGNRFKQHAIPAAPFNATMQAVCMAEYRASSWLKLPFGTSVLAILKKR